MTTEHDIAAVLSSPCTSYWLRDALQGGLRRDPCDAASDAEYLAQLLGDRADRILGRVS